MQHVLFYDSECNFPYSSESLLVSGSKIGGTEGSVIRIAEGLSKRYRVSVGQHNRIKHEKSTDHNIHWLTKKEATDSSLDVDVVVVLRRVGDLPLMKWYHPRARLFVWSHDWLFPCPSVFSRASLTWRAKTEMRFLLHACYDAVNVGVSRTHMENIRDSLNKTRLIGPLRDHVRLDYVYNSIPENIDVLPESAAYDPTKLIFVSAPWKGLDMVLKSFKTIRQHIPDLKLHVASPGYAYQPAEKLDESLTENVIFLGSLSHAAVLHEMRSALCVFYPANKVPETFGLVFAESNAVGTPVLTHPIGAAPELLTPEQLVDARDTNAIIERLRSWKNGGRPVVKAKEEFRLSNVIRSWERVLFSQPA
ncbi:glycosyltransferase family 4 protein [Nostoc sp. CHAB 5715]|uniref:glycosyltransferase family 4 protein n=1 Tax=Nostoc sp. CHAB 5715 TaxID=2780400 RepID=UPI001E333F23|nr:glycosyltransferase family 4 protein [Nostoc sp. CHAB 5715]MCC5625113.1 glycosyltransferase family 4 protein [Nostoc sp. CHAB 5715]